MLCLCVCGPSLASEFNPALTEPAAGVEYSSGRVIVKFRGTVATAPAAEKVTAQNIATQKVAALSARSGITFKQARRLGPALQVLEIAAPATIANVDAHLAILRADPDVEFAEADLRRFPHAVPNDPLFAGQWYLQNSALTPSAVDAVNAWDLTTGSSGVIVADLDTGVRYDHPDLLRASEGGRLLPGFDFIRELGKGERRRRLGPGSFRSRRLGDGGGGVERGVRLLPAGRQFLAWHACFAGIIGALANNSRGIAGLGWNGWILPVRALGKCGGSDSDILAAMLWAGGVPVDGAPSNPYPARIINMSLGGRGSCLQTYRTAIDQLAARGALVVASVGNEGSVVVSPANCPGVVGVAGIRHVGTKVGFSNLGPGVALGAPGGNCVNIGPGEPCLYSIDTTTNLGTQSPGASAYTDQFRFNVGTSFSAPIVSGIAGLMASVNGRLSPADILARLQGRCDASLPGIHGLDDSDLPCTDQLERHPGVRVCLHDTDLRRGDGQRTRLDSRRAAAGGRDCRPGVRVAGAERGAPRQWQRCVVQQQRGPLFVDDRRWRYDSSRNRRRGYGYGDRGGAGNGLVHRASASDR